MRRRTRKKRRSLLFGANLSQPRQYGPRNSQSDGLHLTIFGYLIVLVVDDDPIVLTNMAAMLDDVGHKVSEASSAREALAILRRESGIQLVITDQAMPHMTGLQLIEEMKDNWPDLPVILATGFAELPPGTDLRQITLAKPFRQHDLAFAVETAMTTPDARRILRFRVPAR